MSFDFPFVILLLPLFTKYDYCSANVITRTLVDYCCLENKITFFCLYAAYIKQNGIFADKLQIPVNF